MVRRAKGIGTGVGAEEVDPVKVGWQCPVCGVANAPHVDRCPCIEPPVQATHYGVMYIDPRLSYLQGPRALTACSHPSLPSDHYLVTRDWNVVNCRRCIRGRAMDTGRRSRSRILMIQNAPLKDAETTVNGYYPDYSGVWLPRFQGLETTP